MSRKLVFCVAAFTLAGLSTAQQPSATENQRDLKIEKLPSKPAAQAKPGKVVIPRRYALVIGIAKYPNLPSKLQLHFSERDAQSIYSVLISPEGGNFKAENVHTLIGSKATLANIRYQLETWLPSVAKPQDTVLVYFAGHGFLYNGGAYLAPYDVDLQHLTQTAYPMAELGGVIGGKIKADSKVLITDACHSGAITPEDTQNINHTLSNLSQSIFSLTASRDREQSFESADWGGGHGIFTYYVVKGLEGEADENGDGIVTADELADYVHNNVRQATDGRQNPTSERGSYNPNMLLAYVPSHAKPSAPPAPKYGTLIVESNMDGVEVFVDGQSVGVVNKSKPLMLPGLAPGSHTIKGVHMGYEPDGPREEMVYPGQETTVSIRILIARRRSRAASDALDKGLKYYTKGRSQNYKKAVEEFQKALTIDPQFSQAALYLGRAYNALYDEDNAQKYFQKAIEIDPDYLEARSSYAGMLLDIGNVDEAIRQLNFVLRQRPHDELALTMQAQAYSRKQMYTDSIESARKAIKIVPNNAEPHLWLAESLRLSGKYTEAKPEYEDYLTLSNFDSKLAGQLNYYVLGFLAGIGRKKQASQHDIWSDLRSQAYFGLCDCDRNLSQYDTAIDNCQKALSYDPQDPFAHYALALSFEHKAVQTGSFEFLPAALKHFQSVVEIDPNLEQAKIARQNIANIEKALQKH